MASPPPAGRRRELRSNFSETAFWQPQLLTGPDGSAAIEFTVPDSVTSWNVWVHAVTRDLKGGSLHKEMRSVKDLMVRPYLPRFLRQGDRAGSKVVVNNASDHDLSGVLTFDILDPDTNESLLPQFGLAAASAKLPFTGERRGLQPDLPHHGAREGGDRGLQGHGHGGRHSATASSGPLPVLPGRMHLSQSRFVTLKDRDRKDITFADLAKNDDPTPRQRADRGHARRAALLHGPLRRCPT